MYAKLHRTSGNPTDQDSTEADAPHAGESRPDANLRLRQIGGPIALTVRLTTDRPADPGAFEVRADHGLGDADAVPTVASVITFTGPVSEEVEKAAEWSFHERILPGMADHPGGVRLLSLWQPELRRQVTITLATSVASLDEGGKKIGSMPLLPGEDVALLPGPDHVEMFRVESLGVES